MSIGESSSMLQPSVRQTDNKCTDRQTFFSPTHEYAMASDHTYYAFSFREADDQEKLKQAMEEWLAVKEEMLVKLKTKVGQLQKEIEHYKERAFRLKNFKEDNAAIQFYTGFLNYQAPVAFHDYIKGRLQYWGNKDVPDSQPFQEEGKKKQAPKDKRLLG